MLLSTGVKPRRTKKEMEMLDLALKPLYERGLGCRAIAGLLKESPVVIFRRVRRLGILRTKSTAMKTNVSQTDLPFAQGKHTQALREAGIAEAVRWFTERGYAPSIPIVVRRYDMVVESDEGLKRVQVKTTTEKEPSGSWSVCIARAAYDRHSTTSNANGKRRRKSYTASEVDLFFIVTGDLSLYLIPISVVQGLKHLALDIKYAGYRVH